MDLMSILSPNPYQMLLPHTIETAHGDEMRTCTKTSWDHPLSTMTSRMMESRRTSSSSLVECVAFMVPYQPTFTPTNHKASNGKRRPWGDEDL
ncbi:hypothetical protein GDO81_016564 [Engystomops pustulosus]|uniref:Uncharacterized protein n=1 Tax=Engystomops pustulosus TaxID=76066 RepID=A0AAV7AXE1_ENGPU|nr:hypothetical protein GDO81_016564 [Engystomops pustulosus]